MTAVLTHEGLKFELGDAHAPRQLVGVVDVGRTHSVTRAGFVGLEQRLANLCGRESQLRLSLTGRTVDFDL